MKLDPWDDAQLLAQRLAQPGARLVVVIGAMAWCQKCRDYLPIFEQQAASAPASESHVWLDLEEHSAFLGTFVPDDLPLELTYESGHIVQARVCNGQDTDQLHAPVETGIYALLCADNWASH